MRVVFILFDCIFVCLLLLLVVVCFFVVTFFEGSFGSVCSCIFCYCDSVYFPLPFLLAIHPDISAMVDWA